MEGFRWGMTVDIRERGNRKVCDLPQLLYLSLGGWLRRKSKLYIYDERGLVHYFSPQSMQYPSSSVNFK